MAIKVLNRHGKAAAGALVWGIYMGRTNAMDMEAETTASDGAARLVPTILYARTKDGDSAGIVRIDSEQPEVTIRLSPVAEAHGRLLDDRGEILSGGRVQFGIDVHK